MKERGFVALITVMIVGAIGVSVGLSLILLGLGSSRTSLSIEQSIQAKAMANACGEEALQKIRESTPFTGSGNLSLSGGTCTYTVASGGGQNRTISSTGVYGTITRKVAISVTTINPSIVISAWQEVP